MKLFCALLLAAGSLFAQIEVGQLQEVDIASNTTESGVFWAYEFTYEVVIENGVKTLLWNVALCDYPDQFAIYAFGAGDCEEYSESLASEYSAVQEVYNAFYDQFPDGNDRYGPITPPVAMSSVRRAVAAPDFTTVQPSAPQNPTAIFLDGLGNTLMAVDMTNFATVAQVVVPSTSGPLGIRPVLTGSSTEVWVGNGGVEVTVADLSSQSVVTNILTPSIPESVQGVGIVFTPGGTIALEAVQFYSPDSSGNLGALLVFDAVGRTVTSTLPLKYQPTALLMAPDGSTAYILSNGGMLTHYDVLSGTADLSLSTYTPGQEGGYAGIGAAFIHPDGTRLFWNTGPILNVFDLTMHQVVSLFNSGLPTAGVSFTMSQDGGRVYMSNGFGAVAILDTYFGSILATYNTGSSTLVIGGPPVAP